MKLFLSMLCIFCFSLGFSQKKITGMATDSMGTALPFIPIGLLSLPDSTLIKGTMTDETGNYSLEDIKTGNYLLIISAVGYLEKIIDHIVVDSISKKNMLLNIKLSSSSQILNELSVTAIKQVVEFKNGNITVNVENSPLAQGNTVFDLITKLPGVSVDDKTIMIQGKTGVIIMIDERPQSVSGAALINLLKSMNADLVKSMEVLKNPPVKYDASGTSGMINIVSKKAIVSGPMGTFFSSYSQGMYAQLMAGASFNYKSKKIIFYSMVSAENGHYRNLETFNKKFKTDSSTMYMNNRVVTKTLDKNFNYKIGLDWNMTARDVIGVKVEGDPGSDLVNLNGRNTVSSTNSLGFDYLNSKITLPDEWNITNFDFNYDHKLDTMGSSFSLVSDCNFFKEDISSENSNRFYNATGLEIQSPNNYRSDNKTNSAIFSLRADLLQVLDTSASFEAGIKTVLAKTSNDYLFERYDNKESYVKDMMLSNVFEYMETTYAAYANYNKSIKKLSMKLGLRCESTYLTINNRDKEYDSGKNYFNIFPNISFNYKRSDMHDFQLNLSRRINRPSFDNLNPFSSFRDQYSLDYGNPFLLPDYANRGEFAYTYKGELSASIAYSYKQQVMLYYTFQNDSTKITSESIKNMKSSNVLEYAVFYQKSIIKEWAISVSGTFSRLNYKGDINGLNFNRTGIDYRGNLSNSILIGKNAKLEINGIYMGPSIYGFIYHKPRWTVALALKTSLCKKKLDLTFGVDDIFHTFFWRTGTQYENQDWNFKRMDDTRRFRISLNYKFGKMKIEERTVNASNEEEKERFNH